MTKCQTCGNELPDGAKFCPRCGAPVPSPQEPVATPYVEAPPAPSRSGPILAFWWERFLAWLIDVAIIGIITFLINLFTIFSYSLIPGWPGWVPFLNFDLNGVLLFFYWMFMEGYNGRSFGKSIMGLKVVTLDGSAINIGDAAVESVGKAFLLPIDLIVGWIIWPKKRQRLFNNLSRTIVIKKAT